MIVFSLELKLIVNDVNLIDEEKIFDDDDCSVDCEMDDVDLRGEEKVLEVDEVVSFSFSFEEEEEGFVKDLEIEVCGEDDYSDEEDVEFDSFDYMEESLDFIYIGSFDSGFDCFDDDDEVGGDVRNIVKVKNKSFSERVYKREKWKNYYKKNDLDVFNLLVKFVWDRIKIFDEDICFGDDEEDIVDVDIREDFIVRDSFGEYFVVRERK